MRLLTLLLILMIGCRTPETKVSLVSSKYPQPFRNECIRLYPVKTKDSTIIQTVRIVDTIPGPTIEIDCDSLDFYRNKPPQYIRLRPQTSNKLTVQCPPTLHLKDSIQRLQSTVTEDTRVIQYWREQAEEYQQDLVEVQTLLEVKDKALARLSVIFAVYILASLIAIYILFKR